MTKVLLASSWIVQNDPHNKGLLASKAGRNVRDKIIIRNLGNNEQLPRLYRAGEVHIKARRF